MARNSSYLGDLSGLLFKKKPNVLDGPAKPGHFYPARRGRSVVPYPRAPAMKNKKFFVARGRDKAR